MKQREGLVLEALRVLEPKTILDRTPPNVAKAEQFEAASGVVRGAPIEELAMRERGLEYRLPIELGQKTGFYFDQRGLRARVEELARDKKVLDTYSYVGAFAMAAARGGAKRIMAVDESAIALEVGAICARENGLHETIEHVRLDARKALQEAHAKFDLVVVDPPRLAPSKSAREGALVAYAKIAELGCPRRGRAASSSCARARRPSISTRSRARSRSARSTRTSRRSSSSGTSRGSTTR